MSAQALIVEDVTICYGHVEAVSGVSLRVDSGETLALLGPNGAGKTTLLKAISGQASVTRGSVLLGSQRITGLRPDKITRRGVAHVPEGRQVLAPLTVEENLLLAAFASRRRDKREVAGALEEVYHLFPRLADRRNQQSGLMSGGEQQMLAMGRALVTRPDVLLLDEPSMGLAPVMVDVIYAFLATSKEAFSSTAVLLAEQSRIALEVSDRACILSKGRVVFTGPASEVSHDLTVGAYLGATPGDPPARAAGDCSPPPLEPGRTERKEST